MRGECCINIGGLRCYRKDLCQKHEIQRERRCYYLYEIRLLFDVVNDLKAICQYHR